MAAPIGIKTNMGALQAQRNLGLTSRNLAQSQQRLSSGLRINSAADDAAGMAVSTGLESTIRSMNMAARNSNDAVAMLRTAEGAYETLTDMLIRMRELAIQAGNDTLTDTDRAYLDTEFLLLRTELDRLAAVTEYNNITLLDGTAGDGTGLLTFQVGVRNTGNDRIEVQLDAVDATSLKVNAAKVAQLGDAQTALDDIDGALTSIATNRASIGAAMNQITWAMDNLGIGAENLQLAQSQIRDVDVTEESANFTGAQVLLQAGVSVLGQANGIPNLALQLLG